VPVMTVTVISHLLVTGTSMRSSVFTLALYICPWSIARLPEVGTVPDPTKSRSDPEQVLCFSVGQATCLPLS
jgi:hypothetical protein